MFICSQCGTGYTEDMTHSEPVTDLYTEEEIMEYEFPWDMEFLVCPNCGCPEVESS